MNLMHGSDWAGQDVSGWWVSEKLDGWRALWTGSKFVTRQGNTLAAPDWFTAGMPGIAQTNLTLDGELWAGPGTTHDDVAKAVNSGSWSGLTFRPFDVPEAGLTIEAAQAALAALPFPPHVRPVDWFKAGSTEDVICRMARLVSVGGEGLMARKPGSRYGAGRNGRLLKFKPSIVQAAQGGRPCGCDLE